MWKRLKAWVVWHLAQKEIQELYRWRLTHYEYSRWLAEMPQVSLTLRNMECVVRGNALDAYPDGPWEVWGLRERLRMLTPNYCSAAKNDIATPPNPAPKPHRNAE